jgi:phage tail P2-like protein
MTADPVSLLPGNRTPWDEALSLNSAARRPLDTQIVARFYDPWTCPAHLLGYLAFQRSVDVWNDAWPELRKRQVIAAAPAMHRRKRTLSGLRDYISLAGAELVHVMRPPQRFIAGRALSREDFEQWLRLLPQLRVYSKRETYARQRGAVLGRPSAALAAGAGRMLASIDRARAFIGRHPRLYDPMTGTETSLRIIDIERRTVDRVERITERSFLPGLRGAAFILGRDALNAAALAKPARDPRVLTYTIDNVWSDSTSTLHVSMLAPTLQAVDVQFSRVPIRVTRPGVFIAGRGVASRGALASDFPELAFYDRLYLYDTTRPVPSIVNGGGVAGRHRLGMAPHTAEALIRLDEARLPRRALIVGRSPLGIRVASREQHAWKPVTAAIRANNSIDRIYCDFRITRPLTFRDRPVADGSFRFDQRLNRERL